MTTVAPAQFFLREATSLHARQLNHPAPAIRSPNALHCDEALWRRDPVLPNYQGDEHVYDRPPWFPVIPLDQLKTILFTMLRQDDAPDTYRSAERALLAALRAAFRPSNGGLRIVGGPGERPHRRKGRQRGLRRQRTNRRLQAGQRAYRWQGPMGRPQPCWRKTTV